MENKTTVSRRHFCQSLGLFLVPELYPRLDQPDPLAKYLRQIRAEHYRLRAFVAENNLLTGIKNLTLEQQLEDFDMYFPIYQAGAIKHGVPWLLLWIIHTHETVASRDPNPGRSGYVGAMQRHAPSWPDREIYQAAGGWDWLDPLPQRYHQPRALNGNFFSVDYQEILWAAHFLGRMALQRYPELDYESGILEVVKYNYSAPEHGLVRARKYHQLKALLYPEE